MIRSLSIILALGIVTSLVACGVYAFEFGVPFDINTNYFSETGACRELYAPGIKIMIWLASFSTVSLVYVLYHTRKVNR